MSRSSHWASGAQVVSPLRRARFKLAKRDQLSHEQVILAAPARVGKPGFALRAYATGDACPDIDEGFELLMDVEHVAMTRRTGPCEFLAGAQTRAGVGNRVIGIQSARLQLEQMDGPGVVNDALRPPAGSSRSRRRRCRRARAAEP